MAEEQGKRRRGRRRGRGQEGQAQAASQEQEATQPDELESDFEVTEQADIPGVTSSRFSLRRRKGTPDKVAPKGRTRPGERVRTPAPSASTSPMDFWRSGQARTYRDPAVARKGMSFWKRITSFYFPPWVPVVGIMAIVFGILGVLVYVRQASAHPKINEHWHAAYAIFIGGERQPNIPTFTGPEEIHTHGDGMIHMHPFIPAGEGAGAAIGKFFQYGSGKLTSSELRIPGQRETYKNGDLVPGTEATGVVRILKADSGIHPLGSGFSQAIKNCDAKPQSEFVPVNPRYIPQDGECIRIIFGPAEAQVDVQPDRTIISPDDATRTIEMQISGSGATTAFSPASLELKAGEIVKIVVKNTSADTAALHGFHSSGPDREYGTSDDYVSAEPTLHAGEEGVAVIRFEQAGEYEFRDEGETEGVTPATGKITVEAVATVTPTPSGPPVEEVDVTLDVAMGDSFFEPKELTVEAGTKFRINLTNNGTLIHNLRIWGPDGVYGTLSNPGDDLVTKEDVNPGGTGELIGQLDKPGTYQFRCDFHRTEHTGTLVVQ